MDNDHGITDELREWLGTVAWLDDSPAHKSILAIADRIDAAHERGMADAELSAAPTEAQLSELGYIALPVDADGVPIRVGDVMEWCDSGETLTVEGIGSDVLFYIDGENAEWTAARNKRHHEPTVEDVLRGVVTLCHNTWKEESPFHFCDVDDVMKSGNIAEYAAKLRLAGDAE